MSLGMFGWALWLWFRFSTGAIVTLEDVLIANVSWWVGWVIMDLLFAAISEIIKKQRIDYRR